MAVTTELRCDANPTRLFAKVKAEGGKPRYVQEDDAAALIEFSCADCRRQMRKGGLDCQHILHRFNLLGELVETVLVASDGSSCAVAGPVTDAPE